MTPNKKVLAEVQKAMLTLTELGTAGGLSEGQASRFIELLHDAPTVVPNVNVVEMTECKQPMPALGFQNRLLKAAVPGVCPDYDKPTTKSNGMLDCQEYIARVGLDYRTIECNILGGDIGRRIGSDNGDASGGIVDLIMRLIAQRVALDIEELALLSDTTSADADLALQDGWLKLAGDIHTVDAANSALPGDVALNAARMLPSAYQRNRTALRFFASHDQWWEARCALGDRQTALGDAAFMGESPVYTCGSMVTPVATIPADMALYTPYSNLVLGICRDIHIETDKDICKREWEVVVTCKLAFAISDSNGAVLVTNLALPSGAAAAPPPN